MPTLKEYTGEACAVANNDNNINDNKGGDKEVNRPQKKHKVATETEVIEVVNEMMQMILPKKNILLHQHTMIIIIIIITYMC